MNKNIIYILLLLLFAGCNSNESNNQKAISISKTHYLKDLTSNFYVDDNKSRNGYLFIHEKSLKNKKRLSPISVKFSKTDTVKFLRLKCENNKEIKFKLYLNGYYKGSYSNKKKIAINQKISSLRIVEIKSDNEIIVNAWDRKNEYILLKDTSIVSKNLKTLQIEFADKNVNFKNPIKIRKPANKNFKNIKELNFINLGARLIVKDKKRDDLIEQTVCFYDDMSFFINFIKVNSNNKIEYEYYLSGSWYPIRHYGNRTKIKLTGEISGKLNPNEQNHTQLFEDKILIDSLNILRTRSILNKLMIDLPNWAMVNLRDFGEDIIIDLPYATPNNFTKTKLYDCNECYLLYETVKDLLKAQHRFLQKGYRLKMFDCYRPYHIQRKLFEKFPVPGYVADPVGGSVHNKGSAVDLTIVDMQGNELDMGTHFDDLSRKSNHAYTNFSDTILNNRKLLLETMRASNFTPISMEWWHYNHRYSRKYPKIDDAFPCKNK